MDIGAPDSLRNESALTYALLLEAPEVIVLGGAPRDQFRHCCSDGLPGAASNRAWQTILSRLSFHRRRNIKRALAG